MADYAAVNAAYAPLFQDALPPSRVAIGCGELLPPGVRVVMTIDMYDHGSGMGAEEKRGLHVQSRSYWAPANIGPYSQAIYEGLPIPPPPRDETSEEEEEGEGPQRESRLVHMAGQIPLVPMTMDLAAANDLAELVHGTEEQVNPARLSVALSLQHLWRVGQATDVRAWAGGLAFVNANSKNAEYIAQDALQQWKDIHVRMHKRTGVQALGDAAGEDSIQELFSFDSEQTFAKRLQEIQHRRTTITEPPPLREDVRPPLPDHTCIISSHRTVALHIPPVFAALIAELPRDAPVEWHSTGFVDSGIVQHGCVRDGIRLFHTASCSSTTTMTWISVPHHTKMDCLDSLPGFKWTTDNKRPLVTLYAAGKPDIGWVRKWQAQVVPCYAVLGEDGPLHGLVVVTWYPR
jgi:diphthine-ammonia ligase